MTQHTYSSTIFNYSKAIQSICLIIPLAFFCASKMAAAVVLAEFQLPYGTYAASGVVNGSDGNFWFADAQHNAISKMTPVGVITEYPVSTKLAIQSGNVGDRSEIILGSDGNVWFTESYPKKIGKITPNGVITEYPLPFTYGSPSALLAGPDGNLWVFVSIAEKFLKITPNGNITEYPLPSNKAKSGNIFIGPDGNLWFFELNFNRADSNTTIIAKMTPSGVITEYPMTENIGGGDFAVGSDGNLWFSNANNNIHKMTIDGVLTTYPTTYPVDIGLVKGSDGNLWFTGYHNNKIGKITPSGTVTEYATPSTNPFAIVAGADENLWFLEGANPGRKLGKITPDGSITEYDYDNLARNIPTAGTKIEPFTFVLPDYYIESSQNAALYSQAVTFTATVIGNNATGRMQFMDGGKPIGSPAMINNGKAYLTLSNLTVGRHIISASYGGDVNNPSKITSSLVQVVNSLPPSMTKYPLSDSKNSSGGIVSGSDGNIWFTKPNANIISKATLSGVVTDYSVPTGGSYPFDITAGSDGNLWFTENQGNKIGKITPDGKITEYPLRTGSYPSSIGTGPDGNLWFTTNNFYIGKMTPSGVITEYPITSDFSGTTPKGIIVGADGSLWFRATARTDNPKRNAYFIGKLNPNGQYTQYPVEYCTMCNLTLGADGNIWFLYSGDTLAKITPDGTITKLPKMAACSATCSMVMMGSDGNLWLTGSSHIGININQNRPSESLIKITQDGREVSYLFPLAENSPATITPGADGNLWFVDKSGNNIGKISLDHVVSSINPSAYGQAVTLFASITGNAPTGTVQFMDGGNPIGNPVTLSGGVATYTTTALTTGSHKLTAFYSGDAQNLSQTLSALTQVVISAPQPTVTPTPSTTPSPTPVAEPNTPVISISPSASAAPGTAMTLSIATPQADVSYQLCFGSSTGKYGSPCMPIKSSFSFKMPAHLDIYGAVKAINAQGKSSALSNELHVTATDDDVTWDESTHTATIRDVKVGATHYRVKLIQTGNPYFGLKSTEILNQPQSKQPADYDDIKQDLTIPLAQVNGRYFQVTLHNIGKYSFRLDHFEEIK